MAWNDGGMAAGGWVFIGLFWIALIAAITWLVLRLAPSKTRTDPIGSVPTGRLVAPGQESPFDILDRRLASGDIDTQTYEAHHEALTAARGGTR